MIEAFRLAETVDRLRYGRTDLLERLKGIESRFDNVEEAVEAFVEERDRWDRVRERGTELATTYPESTGRPPLYGVPVGVKDIFHVDGLETRAGSSVPPERLAGEQATAVDRLQAAGAIVLGKTVTAEFAYFEPGPTRNPHDLEYTPGGSSSGSAAAVAAGLCPAAVGTQTIGSVIRPTAFCGIVGFKPTFDRIPTDGVIPASPSVDHVGVFTQDLAGARLLAAVLCEEWRTLPDTDGTPTLGVPDGAYLEQASAAGRDAFAEQVDRLSDAGFEVERVELFGDIEAINDRHERLMAAEMAIVHEQWYDKFADQYAAKTRELIERGRETPAAAIGRGRGGRGQLRQRIASRMDETGVDVWLSPAAPGPAPEGIETTGDPVMNLPWTHAGVPAVSLPAGTVDGLPVGLQCTTRFGGDEDLLRWAEQIRTAL